MNAFTPDSFDLKKVGEAALNFYKLTSGQWLDLMEKTYRESGNGNGNGSGSKAMRSAADSLTQWFPWQKGIFDGTAVVKPDMSGLLAFFVKQNENCSNLGKDWFNCTLKMMEAMRLSIQQRKDPAEALECCRESAAQYWQSYLSFMDSQYFQSLEALKACQGQYNGNGKAEDVKSEARPAKSAK